MVILPEIQTKIEHDEVDISFGEFGDARFSKLNPPVYPFAPQWRRNKTELGLTPKASESRQLAHCYQCRKTEFLGVPISIQCFKG